jgi:PAS domain S-box-containing protein
LAPSEAQLQLLIDGVADYAIYLLDPEGCVASWNSGAKRIKGYEPHEILGVHFERFYTSDDIAKGEPRTNLDRARELGRAEAEGWRVRKDGTQFWAHVVIDRIVGEDGTLLGFAKVTRDVTDKRRAQRDLDAAREALFQAQKMDALGKLTGGVAHDFNNLLMAVQSALDLLKARFPDDEKADVLINLALASVSRGASLTRRMLGFARQQVLKPIPVEPGPLIHGMLDLLSATAGPHTYVTTEVTPHLPLVFVDPQELELALINLVANARDAVPQGGHIVLGADASDIEAANGRPGGRYLCLSVTDDGEGMSEDVLGRATDPFFTTKEIGKGTGLGLSAVDGLAAQSGGWLQLRSEPGQGTRAEIWLPATGTAAADGAGAEQRRQSALSPPDARALRILLVDDDPLVLQTIAALLEDLGHTVISAQRGQHALDLLANGAACDVLMTDYAMPGMTGKAVAEAARELRPHLAIILASGYADLDAAALSGLTRLTKPFDRRTLASALKQVTAGASYPTSLVVDGEGEA